MCKISETDRHWIESYTTEVLQHDPPQEIADGYDTSVLLAVDVFEYASKQFLFVSSDPNTRLLEVTRYGQALWEYLCDFIETADSSMVCQKLGFLAAVNILSQHQLDQRVKGSLQNAVASVMKERGSDLLKDPVPTYPTMSKDEVDQIIDQCDSNLVTEFFDLFKGIKVFYGDPKRYDDPADVKRYRKMMAIFSKMTGDSRDVK